MEITMVNENEGSSSTEVLSANDGGANGTGPSSTQYDLVGGPFAVIESDPGLFTTLIRRLGIQGIEVEEVYDIQPWALDHLKPKGLILCFLWRHDSHRLGDFQDPSAKRVWFANQLSEDACASQAILNVLFNCPDVDLGCTLSNFKSNTEEMSSIMKGLAVSNLQSLRVAQNSMARPADIRGAINTIAEVTHDATKSARKPIRKKRRMNGNADTDDLTESNTSKTSIKVKKIATTEENEQESYHFIGYVPAYGKVWELDGLKSGPLEVGELPSADTSQGWENVVRPALRMKMEKYGGGGDEGGNIRFNLLALVEDRYETKSDDLEMLKREKVSLERRLNAIHPDGWQEKVNHDLAAGATEIFTTLAQSSTFGPTFAKDFGSRKMDKDMAILRMGEAELCGAWEGCLRAAIPAKIAVDEEIQKAIQAKTDHLKRTHDYEPFIREFVTCLHDNELLPDLLPQKSSSKTPANRKGATIRKKKR